MQERLRRGEWVNSSACTSFRDRIRISKTFCRSGRLRGKHPFMLLARVIGTVVATRKDPRLEGKKLLICRPMDPDGNDEKGYLIAVDTVHAGFREHVLIVQGSSARMAYGCKDTPMDAAIVAIVDQVSPD